MADKRKKLLAMIDSPPPLKPYKTPPTKAEIQAAYAGIAKGIQEPKVHDKMVGVGVGAQGFSKYVGDIGVGVFTPKTVAKFKKWHKYYGLPNVSPKKSPPHVKRPKIAETYLKLIKRVEQAYLSDNIQEIKNIGRELGLDTRHEFYENSKDIEHLFMHIKNYLNAIRPELIPQWQKQLKSAPRDLKGKLEKEHKKEKKALARKIQIENAKVEAKIARERAQKALLQDKAARAAKEKLGIYETRAVHPEGVGAGLLEEEGPKEGHVEDIEETQEEILRKRLFDQAQKRKKPKVWVPKPLKEEPKVYPVKRTQSSKIHKALRNRLLRAYKAKDKAAIQELGRELGLDTRREFQGDIRTLYTHIKKYLEIIKPRRETLGSPVPEPQFIKRAQDLIARIKAATDRKQLLQDLKKETGLDIDNLDKLVRRAVKIRSDADFVMFVKILKTSIITRPLGAEAQKNIKRDVLKPPKKPQIDERTARYVRIPLLISRVNQMGPLGEDLLIKELMHDFKLPNAEIMEEIIKKAKKLRNVKTTKHIRDFEHYIKRLPIPQDAPILDMKPAIDQQAKVYGGWTYQQTGGDYGVGLDGVIVKPTYRQKMLDPEVLIALRQAPQAEHQKPVKTLKPEEFIKQLQLAIPDLHAHLYKPIPEGEGVDHQERERIEKENRLAKRFAAHLLVAEEQKEKLAEKVEAAKGAKKAEKQKMQAEYGVFYPSDEEKKLQDLGFDVEKFKELEQELGMVGDEEGEMIKLKPIPPVAEEWREKMPKTPPPKTAKQLKEDLRQLRKAKQTKKLNLKQKLKWSPPKQTIEEEAEYNMLIKNINEDLEAKQKQEAKARRIQGKPGVAAAGTGAGETQCSMLLPRKPLGTDGKILVNGALSAMKREQLKERAQILQLKGISAKLKVPELCAKLINSGFGKSPPAAIEIQVEAKTLYTLYNLDIPVIIKILKDVFNVDYSRKQVVDLIDKAIK